MWFCVDGKKKFRYLSIGCLSIIVLILCSSGLILEKLGLKDTALNIITKVINLSPENKKLYLHASRLCLKKGQVDKAVMYWKKAAGPENIGSFLYWLNKYQRQSRNSYKLEKNTNFYNNPNSDFDIGLTELSINHVNDVGLELLEKGCVKEALLVFQKDLKQMKTDSILYFNIGLTLSKLNRHSEALDFYEKAQGMELNNLELLNNKGYSLFFLDQFEEAQTCYELARGLAPSDYTILNNLAACYLKTNQELQAEDCFIKASQNNPDDAILKNNLAMCLEVTGRASEALKHYEKALSLERNFENQKNILINKINCLIFLNRFNEALEAYDGYSLNDDEFELWGLKADLLNELGRTAEAAEGYRKALGLTG